MNVCWEYVTGSRSPGPPVMAPDGSLRLHCSDGSLHCVSCEGRQIYAPMTIGEPLGWAAPIADADGNTWISGYEGGLLKVDADGRLQSSPYFRSRQKLNSGGVLHDGVLYIGSEDGYVFAIEMGQNKGRNLWDHGAGQGVTGWYIHCWPAMTEDGTLVVAGRDEHLYGFTAEGKQAWASPMPGQLLASPVIDRLGQIYLGISLSRRGEEPRGMLVCIDGNSHKPRWEYEAAGPVESTPAIGDDDLIYFGDNTGTIHAVDFEGKPQWTARVETAVRSAATIVGSGRVAFGLDNETLVVLKCDAQGLAEEGWPKIGKTVGQCGLC